MDDVFSALSHPARRTVLDLLNEKDGRTLTEIEGHLTMTRFGVMKHLKVLEDAHLIVTRKVGRAKFHYLNPVPIQQLSDRWISRYASPFVQAMSDLKTRVEAKGLPMSNKAPKHVHQLFIRGSAEDLWSVITDDAKTPQWQHFNMTSETELRVGGAVRHFIGGNQVISGEIIECEPPHRLVMTFKAGWSPDVAGEKPSRVTWEITPVGPQNCKLTLTHDDFEGETATYRDVTAGWYETLSRLKTLVETGTPLEFSWSMPAAQVA